MAAGNSNSRVAELKGGPTVSELEGMILSGGLREAAVKLGVTPARLDQIRCRYGIDLAQGMWMLPESRTFGDRLGDYGFSWSWLAFFLGPFYFVLSRAYVPAVVALFPVALVQWFIPFARVELTGVFALATAIVCALLAKRLSGARLLRQDKARIEQLQSLGYSEAVLAMAIRERERGGSWESVFTVFGLLVLYVLFFWGVIFGIGKLLSGFSG